MSTILDKTVSESQIVRVSKNRDFIQIRRANPKDIKILGVLWFYQRCYHEQWDELYASVPSAQQDWEKLVARQAERIRKLEDKIKKSR